jgi:hypothetical protein
MLALALLGAATLFLLGVLRPLEERGRMLDARLAQAERRSGEPASARPAGAAAKLAAFYAFFDKGEQPAEWLGRLHQIAARSGVELRSADYRMQRAAGRLERYEITLPVSATYPQLRAFLRGTLAEIPVLSLDQVAIKRQRASDGQVQAEVRVTLHMVKP